MSMQRLCGAAAKFPRLLPNGRSSSYNYGISSAMERSGIFGNDRFYSQMQCFKANVKVEYYTIGRHSTLPLDATLPIPMTLFLRPMSTSAANVQKLKSSDDTGSDMNIPTEEGESTPSGPRLLPTRHSRHRPPQISPFDRLSDLKKEILNANTGSLYAYSTKDINLNKEEEYESALVASDATRQKLEYILFGYSALIPDTIVHRHYLNNPKPSKQDSQNNTLNQEEIIDSMLHLIDRIEREGLAYVQLRSKYRSQLARVHAARTHNDNDSNTVPNPNTTSNLHATQTDNDDNAYDENQEETWSSDENEIESWRMNRLMESFGAPPGPSTRMYDTLSDTIATSLSDPSSSTTNSITAINRTMQIMFRVLERHLLDASNSPNKLNTNVNTLPTPATFNAVIRAAAHATSNKDAQNDEPLRDAALNAAFLAFDSMYHHTDGSSVRRNSATYVYLLQVIANCIPFSRTRGNIVNCIFENATEEGVVDSLVLETLVRCFGTDSGKGEIGSGNGADFDRWMKEDIEDKLNYDTNGFGFPITWSRNKLVRRYHKLSNLY
mmetsp:Transcript_19232/g.27052  ORF Transcript_19232/g.27052 Transcript_19232/m.27052 type:complete len:552 (-) Transcript_19232:130-1785(-)